MTYLIYSISDPITRDIVYIGCTEDLYARALRHIKSNTLVSKWISTIPNGFNPIYNIEYTTNDINDASLTEYCYINAYKSQGYELLNSDNAKPYKDSIIGTKRLKNFNENKAKALEFFKKKSKVEILNKQESHHVYLESNPHQLSP